MSCLVSENRISTFVATYKSKGGASNEKSFENNCPSAAFASDCFSACCSCKGTKEGDVTFSRAKIAHTQRVAANKVKPGLWRRREDTN
jgi:hypothetical protein